MEAIIKEITKNPYFEKVLLYANQLTNIDKDRSQITKQRAIWLSQMLKYPLLGSGMFRFVLKIDNFAVKIPIQQCGFSDNDNEKWTWDSLTGEEKRYFLPCLGGTEQALIFPLANPLKYDEYKKRKTEIEKIVKYLDIDTVADWQSNENWGIYDGRLVLLDYAECV